MKKISVIMSAYKESEEHIRQAIESILNQTFIDYEFIIILDNPENKMLDRIIREYEQKDERIVYLKNERNLGLAKSLNKGIQAASTDIIARMDADDISMPTRLEIEYSFYISHPEFKVVSVNKINIDENGNLISYGSKLPDTPEKIKKGLHYINMILHPGAMFDRQYIYDLGGYRELVPAEDHDLWLRVISEGGQIGLLDKHLVKYRTNQNNLSSTSSLRMWITDKYVIELYNERKKHQKDSFSELNRVQYLKKRGCDNVKLSVKFKEASYNLNMAKAAIKNKRILKGIILFTRAISSSNLILEVVFSSIKYKCTTF